MSRKSARGKGETLPKSGRNRQAAGDGYSGSPALRNASNSTVSRMPDCERATAIV